MTFRMKPQLNLLVANKNHRKFMQFNQDIRRNILAQDRTNATASKLARPRRGPTQRGWTNTQFVRPFSPAKFQYYIDLLIRATANGTGQECISVQCWNSRWLFSARSENFITWSGTNWSAPKIQWPLSALILYILARWPDVCAAIVNPFFEASFQTFVRPLHKFTRL